MSKKENKQEKEPTNQTEQQSQQQEEQPHEEQPVKLEELSIEELRKLVSFQSELNKALQNENEELIKKSEELRKIIAKSDSYLDQLVAMKKDFESYKQRIRTDGDAARDEGLLKAVERIFPLLDTLEKARVEMTDGKAYELIYRQFCKALFEMGITEIDVLGKPFDPNIANAIMSQEVEEERKNTVIEVYQKGFTYKDRVLRYAAVVVGK